MKKTEYENWVEFAAKNFANIPAGLINNYADWHHRSTLGRYLLRAGQPLVAIQILRSVMDEEIPLHPCHNKVLSDVENVVWCLQDLAAAVFRYEHAPDVSLKYLEQALSLSDRYDQEFEFVVRGDLWRDKLDILAVSGRSHEAKVEAFSKIASIQRLKGKSNSFLFNAYDFLADLAAQSGRMKAALWLMREALRYYPSDKYKIDYIENAWRSRRLDPNTTFENLKKLTQEFCLIWDDTDQKS